MERIKPRPGVRERPLAERAAQLADELAEAIGEDKVSTDLPTRLVHRFTHGPEALLHADLNDFLPALVVHPRSTEDVEEALRLANELLVPVVPQGGRTGTFGAEAVKNGMALDMCSMTEVLEFDEARHIITAEAGIRIIDFLAYIEERGYMSPEFPTMNRVSTLGARVAVHGYNKFFDAWGPSGHYVRALEVVLPFNAKAVWLGDGSKVPHKSQVGLCVMPLFFGSKGALGVITKVTEFFIDRPEEIRTGIMAFEDMESALRAYVELRKRAKMGIWRVKSYNRWFVAQAASAFNIDWPEEAEQLVEFHVVGDKDVVELLERKAYEICKRFGGFWRPDMPEPTFLRMHGRMEVHMGLGAIWSERMKRGGLANKLVPFDPALPDDLLAPFFKEFFPLLREIEDGEHYPALATCVKVLSPGAPVPAYYGWSKLAGRLLVNWKRFDGEARSEFKDWFRRFAELVWRYGGTLTMTHGFIPRELRREFVIREVGEGAYELMKMVKGLLDPNNIMNPYVLP